MRIFLLLLFLLASPAWAATLSTTTCTSTVKTGCVVMDLSALNQLPSTIGVQLSGTWTGTVQFEGSVNGSTYVSLPARPSSGGSWVSEATSPGIWGADVAGLKYFRARASALSSGSVTVDMVPSTARPVADVIRAVGADFGQVSITTATDGGLPVTLGAQRVAVEATGPAGESVVVSGTVGLSGSSLAALGPLQCVFDGVRRVGIGGTPTSIPPDLSDGGIGSMPSRTELLIANTSSAHRISCRIDPGDGGLPDCSVPGFGLTLFPNGGYVAIPARDNVRVRCVACSGANIPTEYLEERCVQP